MRVGLVQLSSGEDPAANLDAAERGVIQAAGRGASFVALPEVVTLRVGPAHAGRYAQHAEPIPGPTTQRFGDLATKLGIHLLLGSIIEKSPDPKRTYNTSALLGPEGKLIATYRKIHLFDVCVDDRNGDRESDRYLPGDKAVVADTAIGKVGLTICYDLRFPELYRRLALDGAELAMVPANFTKATGQAHWLTLLRARAIENGMFILAPAQCGAFPGGFEAFGHSAIIDPWGRVLAERDDAPGVLLADLDMSEVDRVRKAMPVLDHHRPDVYESTGCNP